MTTPARAIGAGQVVAIATPVEIESDIDVS
jgi:hypothetical protein